MNHMTHLDDRGRAAMVDVSAKSDTRREAVAIGVVRLRPETAALLKNGAVPKGDVWAAARIAGILAAKRTDELIPLCHSLPLHAVSVHFRLGADTVTVRAVAVTVANTGVEMEALTAVSVAALTIYDMCKAVDREMSIGPVFLQKKTGGRSGTYERAPDVINEDAGPWL